MAKDKEQEALYKAEGQKRIKQRKKDRLDRWINMAHRKVGTGMYERMVELGEIRTCEWGSRRCDIYGCNGDC